MVLRLQNIQNQRVWRASIVVIVSVMMFFTASAAEASTPPEGFEDYISCSSDEYTAGVKNNGRRVKVRFTDSDVVKVKRIRAKQQSIVDLECYHKPALRTVVVTTVSKDNVVRTTSLHMNVNKDRLRKRRTLKIKQPTFTIATVDTEQGEEKNRHTVTLTNAAETKEITAQYHIRKTFPRGRLKVVQKPLHTYTNEELRFSIGHPLDAEVTKELNDEYNRLAHFENDEYSVLVRLVTVYSAPGVPATMDTYKWLGRDPEPTRKMLGGQEALVFKSTGYCDAGRCGDAYVTYATLYNGEFYNVEVYGNMKLDDMERDILQSFTFVE